MPVTVAAPANSAPVDVVGGQYTGLVGVVLPLRRFWFFRPGPWSAKLQVWVFGDGSLAGVGVSLIHEYTTSGNNTATLAVADPSGTSD